MSPEQAFAPAMTQKQVQECLVPTGLRHGRESVSHGVSLGNSRCEHIHENREAEAEKSVSELAQENSGKENSAGGMLLFITFTSLIVICSTQCSLMHSNPTVCLTFLMSAMIQFLILRCSGIVIPMPNILKNASRKNKFKSNPYTIGVTSESL